MRILNYFKNKRKRNFLKITLHPLFIILGVLLFFLGDLSLFIICTVTALMHEYAHSVVASRRGYTMQKIRLMPFGAELFGDNDSFSNSDELYIALSGPIINIFITIVIMCLWWIKPELYNYTYEIFSCNLVMGVFNLLPIFPLDGGRVVLCFLSKKMERRVAARLVKNITKVFAVLLFLAFIFMAIAGRVNLSFGIMSFLLFFSSTSAMRDSTYQKIDIKQLVKEKCVEWAVLSVPAKTPLYTLKKKHVKNKVLMFIVLDDNGKELFSFSELTLDELLNNTNQTMLVKDIQKILYHYNNKSLYVLDKNKNM